jgi:hypothetical protein
MIYNNNNNSNGYLKSILSSSSSHQSISLLNKINNKNRLIQREQRLKFNLLSHPHQKQQQKVTLFF